MTDTRTTAQRHDWERLTFGVDANDEVLPTDTGCGRFFDAGLARKFSQLARELQTDPDQQAVLQRIVNAAVSEIPAAVAAAVTLRGEGDVTSPASSNAVAAAVVAIQTRTGEGPWMDAFSEGATIRRDDLREDTRWPRFAAEAVSCGVLSLLSLLSFPVFVGTGGMSALEVYSDTTGAFDSDAERIGVLLVSHAAIAVAASRTVANLHTAIDSRDVIGQAKGILLERYKLSSGQAFDCSCSPRRTPTRNCVTSPTSSPPPANSTCRPRTAVDNRMASLHAERPDPAFKGEQRWRSQPVKALPRLRRGCRPRRPRVRALISCAGDRSDVLYRSGWRRGARCSRERTNAVRSARQFTQRNWLAW